MTELSPGMPAPDFTLPDADGQPGIVDYKTARRPPADIADVPAAVLRQMAAYAAALESTYPGRSVEAALLCPRGRVVALERDAEALALIRENGDVFKGRRDRELTHFERR